MVFWSSFAIVIGVVGACFIPNMLIKMLFVGIAGGAEGAFSSLFTIFINESSRKDVCNSS